MLKHSIISVQKNTIQEHFCELMRQHVFILFGSSCRRITHAIWVVLQPAQLGVKCCDQLHEANLTSHGWRIACVGIYLGNGTFSVRGSTENDHAIAHLEVRPCTCNPCLLFAINAQAAKLNTLQ